MKFNAQPETTLPSWLWRAALGPAQIADGVFMTVTLGSVNLGLALGAARRLAASRLRMKGCLS